MFLTLPAFSGMIQHLLCCQGLAVVYYSFTLDASDLPVGAGSYERHPRLLQH